MQNTITTLNRRRSAFGFTLVEIMIVVAILAFLAAIAVPGWFRARKRSQAARVLNDLRLIDAAVDQYAVETGKKSWDPVFVTDWTTYLKKDTPLYNSGKDIFGHDYGWVLGIQFVDQPPNVPYATYEALSDVADLEFWSPYMPW